MDVLFKTVHGSRLYGLSHANSDEDFYTVVSKVKTKKAKYSTHKIVGDVDSVVVDLGTWLRYCEMGVPQALEAMFSNMALVDRLTPLRVHYHVGTQVYDRYLRTIKSFALNDETDTRVNFKKKRHAMRLALNMYEMRGRGRFNPTLDTGQIDMINVYAELSGEECYRQALALAWS
jgi:predicted nucleotidyltransferase